MERISTKRVVVRRGEKLALPKADASMEVPGTPKELLYVYDEKMLRTVGDEFQLDVAPQAVTLAGNADLGEWKEAPKQKPEKSPAKKHGQKPTKKPEQKKRSLFEWLKK